MAYTHTYTHTHTLIHIQRHIHPTYTHIHTIHYMIHINMNMRIDMHIHYPYTFIHTYIHTHIEKEHTLMAIVPMVDGYTGALGHAAIPSFSLASVALSRSRRRHGRLPCHKREDTLVDLRMFQDTNMGFTAINGDTRIFQH